MNRAVAILIPAALFALAIWTIVRGIEPMVAQENNNHAIARLLGCEYRGRLDGVPDVLVFACAGSIELHEEIKW
jgi:hypothetical protein